MVRKHEKMHNFISNQENLNLDCYDVQFLSQHIGKTNVGKDKSCRDQNLIDFWRESNLLKPVWKTVWPYLVMTHSLVHQFHSYVHALKKLGSPDDHNIHRIIV